MKMSNKDDRKKITVIVIILLLLLLIGGFAFYLTKVGDKDVVLRIANYYDKDGNKIDVQSSKFFGLFEQSVVNGVEGVYFIDLEIQATNGDSIPLNLDVKSVSTNIQTEMSSVIASPYTNVAPSADVIWTSDQIDVTQFEGAGTTTFSVTVEGSSYTSGLRDNAEKTATLDITVTGNPQADFTVSLTHLI